MRAKQFTGFCAEIDCRGCQPDDPDYGTERGPAFLRQAGLFRKLNLYNFDCLRVRIEGTERDAETGIIGFPSVQDATRRIGEHVTTILSNEQFPFVIGGDDGVLPGALTAAADWAAGIPVGLAQVGGCLNLHTGRTSPTGEFADCSVAAVLLASQRFFGLPNKVVLNDYLALIGYRDGDEAALLGSMPVSYVKPAIDCSAEQVLREGVGAVGDRAEAVLAKGHRGFWLHVNFSVLKPEIFPATKRPLAGVGLDWHGFRQVVWPLAMSSHLIGVSIAGYDPAKTQRVNAPKTSLGTWLQCSGPELVDLLVDWSRLVVSPGTFPCRCQIYSNKSDIGGGSQWGWVSSFCSFSAFVSLARSLICKK